MDIDVGSALEEISTGLGLTGEDDDGVQGDGSDALGDAGDAPDVPAGGGAGDVPANPDARARDGAGRFLKTGDDAGGDAGAGGQPAGLVQPALDANGQPIQLAPGPDDPPKTWSAEGKAAWATATPALRAEIRKREEDFFRGIEGYKEEAGFGKSMKSVIAPYDAILRHHNIDPVAQVSDLMRAHYTLAVGNDDQKVALFQQLAKDYNVPLGKLAPVAAPGDEPYTDPAVKLLQEELSGLKSFVTQEQNRRVAELRTQIDRDVEAFATDPKNVHFNDVFADMAEMLKQNGRLTLAEAYERAIWLNPVSRAKELTRQQTEREAEAKRQKETQAAAEAARVAQARKAAGANVKTKARSGSATTPLGSIDDTLNSAYAAIKGRGDA